MERLLWPPWVDLLLGLSGIVFALWSMDRRRKGKPMSPGSEKPDQGLFWFGLALVVFGVIRIGFS